MKTSMRNLIILVIVSLVLTLAGCAKNADADRVTIANAGDTYGLVQLLASDSYYFQDPIILETTGNRPNLGGWECGAKAYWGLMVPQDGDYLISFTYAREEENAIDGYAKLETRTANGKGWEQFADCLITFESTQSWSTYVVVKAQMSINAMKANEEIRLTMGALCGDNDQDRYFINLQSISLQDINCLGEEGGSKPCGAGDGLFVEPYTGALISFPDEIKYYQGENYAFYNGVAISNNAELFNSNSMVIVSINELNVRTLDEAYKNWSDYRVLAYEGNSLKLFLDDGDMVHYKWLLLLDDGSVLEVTLRIADELEHAHMAQYVDINFLTAQGELGLISVDKLSVYDESSYVCGIWKGQDSGRRMYSPGGILVSLYEANGELRDCGSMSGLVLRGNANLWGVYPDEHGIVLTEYSADSEVVTEELYIPIKTLDINIYSNFPNVPHEGVVAVKASTQTKYYGKWENDTITVLMDIQRDKLSLTGDNLYQLIGFSKDGDIRLILSDERILSFFNDGSAKLEGFAGRFYRTGAVDSR